MEHAQRVMTRLTEELGLSLDKVRDVKIERLKRIPEPPEIYKKWQCLIKGENDPEQFSKARRMLKKQSGHDDAVEKVQEYEKKLLGILNHNLQWAEIAVAVNQVEFEGEGIAPIEKVEIREKDKKRHGNTEWMLIMGFEFWMDAEKMKQRKVYIVMHPESPKFDLMRLLKGQKKEGPILMPGSYEKGYPGEWDEIESGPVDDF